MKRKPLINYDSKSAVIYIVFKRGSEEAIVEVADGINVELDEQVKL